MHNLRPKNLLSKARIDELILSFPFECEFGEFLPNYKQTSLNFAMKFLKKPSKAWRFLKNMQGSFSKFIGK